MLHSLPCDSTALRATLMACCRLSAPEQEQGLELHDTKLAIPASLAVLSIPGGVLQAVGATAGAYLVQHLEPHNLQFAIATSLLVVFILMVCPLAKLLSHLKAASVRKDSMKEPLLPHQDIEGRPACSFRLLCRYHCLSPGWSSTRRMVPSLPFIFLVLGLCTVNPCSSLSASLNGIWSNSDVCILSLARAADICLAS